MEEEQEEEADQLASQSGPEADLPHCIQASRLNLTTHTHTHTTPHAHMDMYPGLFSCLSCEQLWVRPPFASGQIWRLLSEASDFGLQSQNMSLSAGLPGPDCLLEQAGADQAPMPSQGQ